MITGRAEPFNIDLDERTFALALMHFVKVATMKYPERYWELSRTLSEPVLSGYDANQQNINLQQFLGQFDQDLARSIYHAVSAKLQRKPTLADDIRILVLHTRGRHVHLFRSDLPDYSYALTARICFWLSVDGEIIKPDEHPQIV